MFNKIAIIGVGLIGGSIGLAVKKERLSQEVIGVCRHKASLLRAKRLGAIDQAALDYPAAVGEADLVILATPVNQIIKMAKKIGPYLKEGCLVTDVGSTKELIVQEWQSRLPGVKFVGGHPMAGSEKRGVQAASAHLFRGSTCILTRTPKTNQTALEQVTEFWRKLGCRVRITRPEEHDRIAACVSHLPHLLAAQLVLFAKGSLPFAASGFFDTTRIASSDGEVWTDIFLSNKKFITQAIDRYADQLKSTRDLISKGNKRSLTIKFKKAKVLRDAWQTKKYYCH